MRSNSYVCSFLTAIRQEIAEIENKISDKNNNLLKNAPHTIAEITSDVWDKPYSRQRAAFPMVCSH